VTEIPEEHAELDRKAMAGLLNERTSAFEAEMADFRNELVETKLKFGETLNRLRETEETLADTESRLADVEEECEIYRESKSWRLTAPLRRLRVFSGR
jgi:hypothetical protein